MRVKPFSASFLAIYLIIFCSSCRNSTITNNETQPVSGTDAIDTIDCKTFVQKKNVDVHNVVFSESTVVGDSDKPRVYIELERRVKDQKDEYGLNMSFRIDSPICVDKFSHITFFFSDGFEFRLTNFWITGCEGTFLVSFNPERNDISPVEAMADREKVRLKKIHTIRFETHDGYRDYILKDVDAAILRDCIYCLRKAK